MPKSEKHTVACSFLIILICLVYFTGCSGGNTTPGKESVVTQENVDSTLLFDGKSLSGWEITNFGPQGPVYVSGDKIILGMGEGCTGITWKKAFPRTGYEVSLDAMRVTGNDFFCGITFPCGKDPCTLIIGGWGGNTVGLSSIDGKDASENETKTLHNFDTNKWYHIRLAVTDKFIKSWIDTTQVVNYKLGKKKLSIRPEVELSRPIWNSFLVYYFSNQEHPFKII